MQALGVYVFAGLFTRGLTNAGWQVTGVFEDGNFGVKTHRINFPGVPVFTDPSTWPLHDYRGKVHLIYGNPPCASWSCANSKKGNEFHTTSYAMNMVLVGLDVRPDLFVMESVTNLFVQGDALVSEWERRWADAGYVTCRLLENGGRLGLPQRRKRAMFVAARRGINLDFTCPKLESPTVLSAIWDLYDQPVGRESTPYALDHATLTQLASTGQVMALDSGSTIAPSYALKLRAGAQNVTWHVPDRLTPGLAETLPFLPPDRRFEHVPDEIMAKHYWPHIKNPRKEKGRPSLMYRRLTWNKPCAVVTGQGMYFHPDFDRLLTVREQCRMMGVPDDFIFDVRQPHEAYREIGKAVSPLVGEWLGCQVMQILSQPTGREHRPLVNLID